MRNLFLVFLLLASGAAIGQEKFLPGFIINAAGDSVKGQIDYRNWNTNPTSIRFKNANGNETIYSPLDIKRAGVSNDIYVSAIVEVDKSPTETANLTYTAEFKMTKDTVFLRVLMEGSKNLYMLKQSTFEHFFIGDASSIQTLLYKRYLMDVDGRNFERFNMKYRGQLAFYLKDCASIQKSLSAVKYKRTNLVKVFEEYYRCTGSQPKAKEKKEKTWLQMGVIGGLSITKLNFNSTGFDELVKGDYNASQKFAGGLAFDIIPPRSNRKWSLNSELLYTSYEVDGTYKPNTNSMTTFTLGLSYVKLNTMIRFKYPVGKMFVYGNVGISNGLAIQKTNYRKKEGNLGSAHPWADEDKVLGTLRGYEQGLLYGAGVKYKRYAFEVRQERGNGVSSYTALGSPTLRTYFLLAYYFNH